MPDENHLSKGLFGGNENTSNNLLDRLPDGFVLDDNHLFNALCGGNENIINRVWDNLPNGFVPDESHLEAALKRGLIGWSRRIWDKMLEDSLDLDNPIIEEFIDQMNLKHVTDCLSKKLENMSIPNNERERTDIEQKSFSIIFKKYSKDISEISRKKQNISRR